MLKYAIKKLLMMIPMLLVISALIFFGIKATGCLLYTSLGIFPAVTATKEHHLAGNVAALDIDLTQEERAWLDLRA